MWISATVSVILFFLLPACHLELFKFYIYFTGFISYTKNYFMKKFLLIAVCLCSLIITTNSCKKDKLTELEKLPPATQTGANTFGCLVNGKAFLPYTNCSFICDPPLQFTYDPGRFGGQFAIQVENSVFKSTIIFGLDSVITAGRFIYSQNNNHSIRFSYSPNNNICDLSTIIDSQVSATGYVDILKFDLLQGIISGTFEFTLSKTGCETINITNGRFDAKL